MNSKKGPLLLIGGILLAGIIGIVVFGASRGNQTEDARPGSQSGTSQGSSSQPDTSQGNAGQSAADALDVTIENYAFSPAGITVKAGTTVTWTNRDTVKHNVVGDDIAASGLNGELIGKEETFEYTFNKPGTYSYFCEPHPYMKGTVTVTE